MADPEVLPVNVVRGNDAMSLMIDIWLNGFLTGAASGSHTVLSNPGHSIDTAKASEYAHALAMTLHDKCVADPLYLEAVRQNITQMLTKSAAAAPAGEVHLNEQESDSPAGGDEP